MTNKQAFIQLFSQDLPLNKLILAGFALLFILGAAVALYFKLRHLRKYQDVEEEDDLPDVSGTPQVVTFKSAPPAPEPAPIAYSAGNIRFTSAAPAAEPAFARQTIIAEKAPELTVAHLAPPPQRQVNYGTGLLLSDSPNEVTAILNSLADIIFEYDENKVCINLWYPKSQKLAIDLEIFRGKTVTEAMGADNAKLINDALDFVAANGISTKIEFRSFYGSGKWFQSHISPVFDEAGQFTGRTTSLVSDITEQKNLNTELQLNEHRLVAAQKIAKLGDWWYDLATKETYWSDNLYNLLDIDQLPKNTTHFDYYASRVISEDRRGVYQFFADVDGKTHHDNRHTVTTAKGHTKYFRIVRGQPIKDNKGKVSRVTGIIQDISETRFIDRIIRKSQAELLESQTAAKIGNWKWYLGQKTISWSDEVYHIYDVDPKSLSSGLSHFKLLLQYVHPEDKGILLSFLKNPANLRRTSYEFRIITPAGRLKYVSLIIAKIKDGEDGKAKSVMGTIQDISERKKAEINIRETEDNYKQILDGARLAAVSLDRNGLIIFCNKYLADLLGYPQEQLIGLKWYEEFISENLQPVFAKWYQDNRVEPSYVNPVICSNGDERVISWQNIAIYDEDGQIRQTTCIGEDVTDQQKDMQQLLQAKEKAEQASIFKSDFLSTMSHEIRTPMNAVIGTTSLLLEENPRPDQVAYLNTLKFSGENLLGIINDILDYNKIEAGKLELSKTQLNINTLIANIKQSFQAKAQEKGLEIKIEIDSVIPQNLIGDPIRVAQILNNLVSNAIKFTHKGAVTILIREDSRNDKAVKLNFTVADTGIGIEQKNLAKIFEPFAQEAQQRDYGGTGLGLAIIKKLIELHGSDIKVNSVLGKGTQFNFVIAFEYTAEPVKKPAQNSMQKMQEGDLAGMKVLVVDDNKMNILIASRFLNKWHISISEANNGLVATQMVDANDYDLVLMDLQMPVMDGFEASQIIKSRHPELPIIALTADAMPETFAKTRNCGMDDYLTKPFMPEILFEKISKHYKVAVS